MVNNVYTVESVLAGHPDKVCDQLCDTILDSFIEVDKNANVTVECLGTGNTLFLGGEVASNIDIDIIPSVLKKYHDIGYTENLEIINKIHRESSQTNSPIKNGEAGDQGVMYGYACEEENYNYLPTGVVLVNRIAKEIDRLKKYNKNLLPDGKVQLTINEDRKIDTLVICVQHKPEISIAKLQADIMRHLKIVIPEIGYARKTYFNYHSRFYQGGFSIDAGLSGRKIVADTYGGLIPNGGGSFSGKDPYRLDRSGAYMARFIAKNLVANGFCKECLVSLAYVFGNPHPVMINVKSDQEALDQKLLNFVKTNFDLRPPAIVERLNLYNFHYTQTATYGHFCNSKYPWEQIIKL